MRKIILPASILAILILGVSILMLNSQQKPTTRENSQENSAEFHFPAEDEKHEGTWLTWPHEHTYGEKYRDSIEYIWIRMAKELAEGENVHIVAYDDAAKNRISEILEESGANLKRIDFVIAKSDDVWSRDTGPMFVFDKNRKLHIADFAFDGWGKKMKFENDDAIPKAVARAKNLPILDIPDFVLEGGSVELDGHGTALLTKSAVISKNRNPNLSQKDAENFMKKYLGASNFIWLEGVTDEDITDAHIDGFARFFDEKTLLTVSEKDFSELFEKIKMSDYEILRKSKNASGEPYQIVEFPMTKNNVKGLPYNGSYLNFYVGNHVVLLPIYDDENDAKAVELAQKLYPTRKIVPINVAPLYKNGGMIHCVTQQQPFSKN